MSLFLSVDEKGHVHQDERVITDQAMLQEFARTLRLDEKHALLADQNGQAHLVEAFDAPLVIQEIFESQNKILLETSIGSEIELQFSNLFVDDFDRFYGLHEQTYFVLSDSAQDQLFNLLDSFDDESLTYKGKTYSLESFYLENKSVSENSYWSQVYQEEKKPGWDLGGPAETLKDMLPRLKLPKSRILVLGSGFGHDAAFFASNGHVVTAVDFSQEALDGAKALYSQFSNIEWRQEDVFNLPPELYGQFDIVFEHTCFCAVNPKRRKELVQAWLKYLAPQGRLFAIFFSMFKRQGPPYGVTEWEIRRRLEKQFQFIFWSRWRSSIGPRMGRELFVYAQKR